MKREMRRVLTKDREPLSPPPAPELRVVPETAAGDHEVGLCGPEDVVDGSGSQHLPHGLVDHFLIVATAHRHGAQEAHDEHLLQEGVWRSTCIHRHECQPGGGVGVSDEQTKRRRTEPEPGGKYSSKSLIKLWPRKTVTIALGGSVVIRFPEWICASVEVEHIIRTLDRVIRKTLASRKGHDRPT